MANDQSAAGEAGTMAAPGEAAAQSAAGGATPQKTGPRPGVPKPAAAKEKKLVGIEYEVSVPHCLLGTRRVIVDPKFLDDAMGAKAEAIRLYKGNAVRAFEHQPQVSLTGPAYKEVAAAE